MVKTVGELVEMLQRLRPETQICAFCPHDSTELYQNGHTFYIEEQMWVEEDDSGAILYLKKVTI